MRLGGYFVSEDQKNQVLADPEKIREVSNRTCPACLQDITSSDIETDCTIFDCRHFEHKTCSDAWISRGRARGCCVCTRNVVENTDNGQGHGNSDESMNGSDEDAHDSLTLNLNTILLEGGFAEYYITMDKYDTFALPGGFISHYSQEDEDDIIDEYAIFLDRKLFHIRPSSIIRDAYSVTSWNIGHMNMTRILDWAKEFNSDPQLPEGGDWHVMNIQELAQLVIPDDFNDCTVDTVKRFNQNLLEEGMRRAGLSLDQFTYSTSSHPQRYWSEVHPQLSDGSIEFKAYIIDPSSEEPLLDLSTIEKWSASSNGFGMLKRSYQRLSMGRIVMETKDTSFFTFENWLCGREPF